MRQFPRSGFLAIDASALMIRFGPERHPEAFERRGHVAIVDIRGPLTQRDGFFFDSYEAIKRRIGEALASECDDVLLRIDSPGGEVAGCFETARALRAMAAAASKRLYAYAEGDVCSGAYALACAAERLEVSETSTVGSIGVLSTVVDQTGADAAAGLKFAVIASGSHKADGNPHVPLSDDARAEMQSHVDRLAGSFFGLVTDLRGKSNAELAALEARTFIGEAAKQAGLVDQVRTLDQMLAAIAAGEFKTPSAAAATTGESTMDKEEMKKALQAMAEGEDEKEAAWAKKVLSAMAEDEEKEAEDEEKEKEAEDEEKAEGEEDDEEKPQAVAGELAATVQTLSAQVRDLTEAREAEKRASLIASRPDLVPELKKTLAGKPLAIVQEILAAIPKPKVPTPAAAAQATGTRGEHQGTGSPSRLSPEAKQAMDLRMGLVATKKVTVHEGAVTKFGVTLPQGVQ